jgi:phosphonoacetate hydrolase
VNHTSILSGKFPCEHGVIGNSVYHPETGEVEILERAGYKDVETILDFLHKKGASTALLSVRSSVLEYLGHNVDFGISVEKPKDIFVRFLDLPAPPAVESMHAATWILDACYRLVKKNTIDAIYCATNDYMMQQHAPDSKEALRHMKKIDEWLGRIYDLDHDREVYILGGYGMNGRPHLVNLQAVLDGKGFHVFCHSPYREETAEKNEKRHAAHSGSTVEQPPANQLGMRMLYLKEEQMPRAQELIDFLEASPFVDMVSPKEEAVKRFNLPEDFIGDYLVFAADGYAFADFEGEETELESARSNGALMERATPLIAVNASEVPEKYRYSRDIVKIIMESGDRL